MIEKLNNMANKILGIKEPETRIIPNMSPGQAFIYDGDLYIRCHHHNVSTNAIKVKDGSQWVFVSSILGKPVDLEIKVIEKPEA